MAGKSTEKYAQKKLPISRVTLEKEGGGGERAVDEIQYAVADGLRSRVPDYFEKLDEIRNDGKATDYVKSFTDVYKTIVPRAVAIDESMDIQAPIYDTGIKKPLTSDGELTEKEQKLYEKYLEADDDKS
jgi:hypothetical protein